MSIRLRQYAYDLLDQVGLVGLPISGVQMPAFEAAFDAFSNIFKNSAHSKKMISVFATIHRSDTMRSPNEWGEDSALGAPPIPLRTLDFILLK
jgi:hypothetical protein